MLIGCPIGSDLLIAATDFLSESISFDGHHFVMDINYITVHYGPRTQHDMFQCTINGPRVTSTTMTCNTKRFEAGNINTILVGPFPVLHIVS